MHHLDISIIFQLAYSVNGANARSTFLSSTSTQKARRFAVIWCISACKDELKTCKIWYCRCSCRFLLALTCHKCCRVCLANFFENPLFSHKAANDSPRRRSIFAMSKLLRLNPSPSYLPLPQNGHIDDENDAGKETVQSSRAQGKRLPWLQLAVVVVLLLLTGIAGFFIGLSLPQRRLASSSVPDTVPRGLLLFRIPRMRPADWSILSFHRLVQGNIPIQRKLCSSSAPRRRSRAGLGLFDPQ